MSNSSLDLFLLLLFFLYITVIKLLFFFKAVVAGQLTRAHQLATRVRGGEEEVQVLLRAQQANEETDEPPTYFYN